MGVNMSAMQRLFGAILLITGCCIGVGMIGLPIVTYLAGFVPSTVAMLISYFFTTFSGLFLLEATLWFEGRINLPSMANQILGSNAKFLTIFLFLFLFYCLFVAYLSAGGELFAQMLMHVIPVKISCKIGSIICLIFVVAVSCAGAAFVDNFNRIMLFGMVVTYILLVSFGTQNVKFSNLAHADWHEMFVVFPILLVCFGYQNLVPSLTYYLKRDAKALRITIILGNFLPFIIYLVWNYVIIGLINSDSHINNNEIIVVSDLLSSLGKSSLQVVLVVKIFSFFALLTSFIPSTMSFVDFVKDWLRNYVDKETIYSELFVYLLIFAPTILCALFYPQIFLHALSFAGGFIDVLLFGVLPALIIIYGRRKYSQPSAYKVVGGALSPAIILIISLILLGAKLGGFLGII